MKERVLKQDLIIKKGSVFKCIDGTQRDYVNGNYQLVIADGNDRCITVVMEKDSRSMQVKK